MPRNKTKAPIVKDGYVVYFLTDAGKPFYVGLTENGSQRLSAHRTTYGRQIDMVIREHVSDRLDAFVWERIWISRLVFEGFSLENESCAPVILHPDQLEPALNYCMIRYGSNHSECLHEIRRFISCESVRLRKNPHYATHPFFLARGAISMMRHFPPDRVTMVEREDGFIITTDQVEDRVLPFPTSPVLAPMFKSC